MLTVKEINEVSFGKASFSGYKAEDVDNFIDEVSSPSLSFKPRGTTPCSRTPSSATS